MKKQRSIQKLKVNKETISTLNQITGGDGITATSMTSKPKPKESGIVTVCELISVLLRC